jgi:hypothetical protein
MGVGSLLLAAPLAHALVACGANEPETRPGTAPPRAGANPPPGAGSPPQPRREDPADRAGAERPTPPGAAAGGNDDTRLVTDVPAMKPLVESLGYVAQSPKPDQRCDNCLLYTAVGAERGRCQLYAQGKVAAGAWCTSWTKQQAGPA